MKTKTKNWQILLVVIGIITIILTAGCISEQEKGPTCNPPYIKVGYDCCLDENSNSICDKDEKAEEKEQKTPEYEEKPGDVEDKEDVNETKTEPETKKTVTKSEVESWCLSKEEKTVYRGGETIARTNDVTEHNGAWMCHNQYPSNGGTVHLYWTENDEEVYRVTIDYTGKIIKEEKVEGGSKKVEIIDEPEPASGKARKQPIGLVLGLDDLPEGYNLISARTGIITEEEHTYSPEKLQELGWLGGYEISFENEKLYLFDLGRAYKDYLKSEEVIDEQLKLAFENNDVYILSDTILSQLDNKTWRTYNTKSIQRGNLDYFIIEETDDGLKIYKKSISDFMNYRTILNTNSVYNPDKINEVFDEAKQSLEDYAVQVSNPGIGDESLIYKKDVTENGKTFTTYILIFRKLNVYESVQVKGLVFMDGEKELVIIGKKLEEKIR